MKATFACPALVCLLGTIFCRAAADYAPPPFEHYQPILDRMPFGSLPADFGKVPPNPDDAKNAAQAAAEQQKLAKQVNMSAVTVTPDGNTAIGFTDLSAKPPVNHFLLVGESADGWTVTSADYDDELATIEKDGVSITLKLGKGLVDPSTLAEKAPAAAPAPPPARHTLPPAPGAPSAHGHPSLSSRLTALRSQTLPAEPQAAAEAPVAEGAQTEGA